MTREMLKELINDRHAKVYVSIFMPTHRSDTEGRQDAIRLKNLLREAESQLAARSHRRPQIDRMLATARSRINDAEFWKHQGQGLAVFITDEETREYRLAVAVEELCAVDDRFHVAPLLSQTTGDGKFYILSLSQGHVRLFFATRDEIEEVDLRQVPRNIEDALGSELRKDTLQFHTRTAPTVGTGRAERNAMFHGQGGGEDEIDVEQRRYVLTVDRALLRELPDREAPMVIAAPEKLAALYHQESQHPNLAGSFVGGNPDLIEIKQLHHKAWSLIEPLYLAEPREALGLFGQMEDAGRATTDLAEILRAAEEGRVWRLLVGHGEHRWGTFDEHTRVVWIHDEREEGDEDLIERAVQLALLHGAAVHAQPRDAMPGRAPVAALYRF